MDWSKLTDEEVKQYLQENGTPPVDNFRQEAASLFARGNSFVTDPVYNVYVASNLEHLPVYTLDQLYNMSDETIRTFAQNIKLDPDNPHLLERIITILRLAGKIEEPNYSETTDPYLEIALHLDYPTLKISVLLLQNLLSYVRIIYYGAKNLNWILLI